LNLIPVLLIALEQLSANLKYNLTIENGVWWIWRDGESWPLDGMSMVSATKWLVTVSMHQPNRMLIISPDRWEMHEG
jgi:hypothetical protein